MNYNKDSFLAGIAIGRQLKGWSQVKGTGGGSGGIPPVQTTNPPQRFTFPIYTELTCEQEGAIIYYDLDGGTPSTLYNGETLMIDHDVTLNAYAVYGRRLSVMSSFRYIFNDVFNHTEEIIIPNGIAPIIRDDDVVIDTRVLSLEIAEDAIDVTHVDYPAINEDVEVIFIE